MVYRSTITTLKGVTQANPKHTRFKVPKGLIYFLELYFPSGSEALLHVQIFDGGYQVWPTQHKESFAGDDIYLQYDDLYIKEREPFEFDIITWNDDDKYKHLVIVGFGVVTKDIYMARFMPSMMYKEFEEVYMRILEEQRKKRVAVVREPFFPVT